MTNAFTIDPVTRTIEAVTHDVEDYRDIYKHIGADCFDAVRLVLRASNGRLVHVTLWVDDEGACHDDHVCFEVGHRPEERILLAGKALLTGGADNEGNTLPAPAMLTLDDVKAQVGWTQSQITPGFIIRDMATGKIL